MHFNNYFSFLLMASLFVACQNSAPVKKQKPQKEQTDEVSQKTVNPEDTITLIKGGDSILIAKKKVVEDYDRQWSVIHYEFYNEKKSLTKWQKAINNFIRKSLYRSENQAEYRSPLTQQQIRQSLEAFKKDARQDDISVWNMLDSFLIDDQHASFACLKSYSASYTGGAHGSYGEGFYYYDKSTGKELHLKDYLRTDEALLQLCEKAFRKTMGIAQNKPFEETDYSFGGKFYLPDNFKITQKGITFSYNPYEVSNWANGIVEFTMTKAQLAPYLKRKID